MSRKSKAHTKRPNATGRNVTGSRFIQIEHFLMNCDAYLSLSGNAVKVLLSVWKRHNGSNNGQISFGAREGAAIGLSKDQTARALNDLMQKGFLVCTRDASFGTNDRKAREWRLTMERTESAAATKDFLRYKMPQKPSAKSILPDWRADAVENKI